MINRILIIKKTTLFLLFTLLITITYSQNTQKEDTILSIVKNYCLDSLENDPLIIKSGLKLDIGYVYSYTKISKYDKYIYFQNFNEELHSESGQSISKLTPDFDCLILKSDFIAKLDIELQNCKMNKNRVDTRWIYEIQNEKYKGNTIYDVFSYNLYSFLFDLKCIKPKIDYFCKENITWEQTTTLRELYYYMDWELSRYDSIEYDTMITEKFTCPNGDYKIETILNTRKIFDYSNSVIMEVTMDTSYNIITKLMLWSDSTITYSKEFTGIKYSYCIYYDSNWDATSIMHFRYNKKKNPEVIAMVDLRNLINRFPDYYYFEKKEKNFLGVRKKTICYIVNDENLLPEIMYVKMLNKEKLYFFKDSRSELLSVDFYKKGKIVKTKSNYENGKPKEEIVRKYNNSGELIEMFEYSGNRLVVKTNINYKKEKR